MIINCMMLLRNCQWCNQDFSFKTS